MRSAFSPGLSRSFVSGQLQRHATDFELATSAPSLSRWVELYIPLGESGNSATLVHRTLRFIPEFSEALKPNASPTTQPVRRTASFYQTGIRLKTPIPLSARALLTRKIVLRIGTIVRHADRRGKFPPVPEKRASP